MKFKTKRKSNQTKVLAVTVWIELKMLSFVHIQTSLYCSNAELRIAAKLIGRPLDRSTLPVRQCFIQLSATAAERETSGIYYKPGTHAGSDG